MRRLTIDPLTRVEGHGRVEAFLDDDGQVAAAYLVVPELRGFEQLCVGRPVEEMPRITSRICGLCPEAHHMASTKTLDVLFGAQPPPAARAIRELLYCAFVIANHAVHFFALAGPDLLLDATAPVTERTLFGVLRTLGPELARRVLAARTRNHDVIELLGGRRIHPLGGLPGGWGRRVTEAERESLAAAAEDNVRFAIECLELYQDAVLADPHHAALLRAPELDHHTHSLGTVDRDGRVNLYDGDLRVVDPEGAELARFPAAAYREHIAERIEPWTYVKLPYLREPGWTGLRDGADSGVYAVGPLARLNAANGVATPRAQAAYADLLGVLGDGVPRPVHHRMAIHWARLVEQLYAAERMVELAAAPELTDPEVRAPVPATPIRGEAVGSVEAPRGTLLHRYCVDGDGIVTDVDLVVATTSNHAAIALALTGALRRGLAEELEDDQALLDRVETTIRAFDPCLACATHSMPGAMPLEVTVRDAAGAPAKVVRREPAARLVRAP